MRRRGGIENYERQLDDAYHLYQSLGIHAIKTGYVTDTVGGGQSHYGQFAVRHHRKVIETAASYGIMVDAHEPIHDTGERRTWPNMMSREGARGQEYNAWGGEGGNPPEHESILFFTRMLAGPMDFTPGIFDILMKSGREARARRNSRGRARRSRSSSRCTSCSTRRSRWRPTCRRTTRTARLPVHPRRRGGLGHDAGARRARSATMSRRAQQRGAQTWFVGAITDEEGAHVRRCRSTS